VDAFICYKQKCKVVSLNLAHPVPYIGVAENVALHPSVRPSVRLCVPCLRSSQRKAVETSVQIYWSHVSSNRDSQGFSD